MTPTHRHEVLVTDGGNGQSRSALAAVRALHAAGYRPVVTESSAARSLAGASRFCHRTVGVPPVGTQGYAPAVRAEQKRAGIAAVFAASDAALIALDLPGAGLVDKREVARRVTDADLPVVPTWSFPDLDALRGGAADLPFPLVIKPAVSRHPALQIMSESDLDRMAPSAGAVVAQPFLTDPLRAVAGVVRNGRLEAVVHQRYLRIWPAPCGTASAAVTTVADRALEERLPALLRGYDGIFQVQLAGAYVIDLNPRVYGSLPLALAAGVNLPAISCAAPLDGPIVRARPAVHYRWIEGDLRNLLQRVRSREIPVHVALRALRPRRGTAHSVVAWNDPAPAIARLRSAVALRGRP